MLNITDKQLPQSPLSYVAFRVAFLETLERISLARQFEAGTPEGFGFLTEVPFLRAVPPHVQLDLLAETWSRHLSTEPREATLIDESVLYATCETAARIAEQDTAFFKRCLKSGPVEFAIAADHQLASELRAIPVELCANGDFLMISQLEDMPPDTCRRLKRQFKLREDRLEALFDVLGRWHVSDSVPENLVGLLSENEIRRVARTLNLRQVA